MKAEVDGYDLKKEGMKADLVSDNDIIHLNVGGKKMTTKRSTLCQVQGSLLASMFSGRWEDGLERDKDGCVFFDFNAKYFSLILDYLRSKKIETPENPAPLPKIASEQFMTFSNLVRYLGLEDEFAPKKCLFNSHSPGIVVDDDGTITVSSDYRSLKHEFIFGENIYEKGVASWELCFESFISWLFIGLITTDSHSQICRELTDYERSRNPIGIYGYHCEGSYCYNGSFGWLLGNGQCVAFRNGQRLPQVRGCVNVCEPGESVELLWNCTASKLSFVFPNGQKVHMFLPRLAKWRLHVGFRREKNVKIRIVSL